MAAISPPVAALQQPSSNPAHEIVPDDNPHAGEDPAFLTETDSASSTQSLSSSVLNYQYENGRRYHAFREGEYVLPNDDREQDRLDLAHHILRILIGGALFRAPIDLKEARVLDLGTGTGIWAIEMADEYPKAEIIGTDLSPIQPRWVPPNCFFEIDDFESDWGFSKPFNFIHARTLAGSIRDFSAFFRRIKNNLAPGGWVEFCDAPFEFYADDETLERAPNLMEFSRIQKEASLKFGKDINAVYGYKQRLIDMGFKNVKEDIYKVPLNPWPKHPKMKEIGRYEQVNATEGLEAYSLALLTRELGWSNEQAQVFFATIRKEIIDRSLHLYVKAYFVYGQKPE